MHHKLSRLYSLVLCAAVFTFALNAAARELPKHTATFVTTAPDMGPANPSQVITLQLHLQQANSDVAGLIQQLYDPASSQFHQWLTAEQFKSRFSATSGSSAAVQQALAGHNLKVISATDRTVTVQGTIRDIQAAFHTQIHEFKVDGKIVRANINNPVVDEPAGSFVTAISGLTQVVATPYHLLSKDAHGNPVAPVPLTTANPDGLFFPTQCFTGDQTVSVTDGTNTGTYRGQVYGGCEYQPSEIQTAYKLNQLYSKGLDGTGQTIVIIDAFGSPTLAQDVALFDQVYGLPPINLNTVVVNGPITQQNPGFAVETTLDVEWAHAVAPGANIVLVLTPDNFLSSLNAALQFAVNNHLGNVISNSFGAPENLVDGGTIAATEAILEQAAAEGISVNYSSGDDGDFALFEQELGIGIPSGTKTVSYPASSPFATAIGGTSLFLNPDLSIHFQTGWGNNLVELASAGTFVFPDSNPADGFGFIGGAGGGPSGVFDKPRFQHGVPGRFRQVPDISLDADPQTGVEIIFSVNGTPFVFGVGGTSLSCPMFSALWAIGNQAAEGGPIGQAAQTVYDLHDRAIDDILQVSSPDNVVGVIQTPNAIIPQPAFALAGELFKTRRFVSAFAQDRNNDLLNLTFGTDSSLRVDGGWDNVTGLGTPNSPEFIQRLVKQTRR